MMDFDLLKGEEKITTENGALGYKTTKRPLLDISFKIPELRKLAEDGDVNLWDEYFRKAYVDDKLNTLKFILYLRDARGGLGERKIFRKLLIDMSETVPNIACYLINECNLPEYGRWDDLVDIAYESKSHIVRNCIIVQIKSRLLIDMENHIKYGQEKTPVSLLAKWLPSETHSKKTKRKARKMAKWLGLTNEDYRKVISSLRKYIKVLERDMSANRWNEIDYEHVPSKANLIYKKAFIKHDKERYDEYIRQVASGEKKINASVLSPHEIVYRYSSQIYFGDGRDDVLEELWKALPVPTKRKNMLVVRDGSGSMTVTVDRKSNVRAIDIANAITLYMSQFNTGSYKDKFVTFSRRPSTVDLSDCPTLEEKLRKLYRYDDYTNTNLELVFQLLLDTVMENDVPQEEIPDVIIVSDMEFDAAVCSRYDNDTLMKTIGENWNRFGYKLPKLIFWNVNSRTGAIPMRENDNGVILVSGYTPAIANTVYSNELDPYKALLNALNSERYDCVESFRMITSC